MDLVKKVAIVTGSGRGIGKEIALALARRGSYVVLVARTKSEIDLVAENIRDEGHVAQSFNADISIRSEVESLIKKTVSVFGRIDILVNSAGCPSYSPIKQLEEQEWDRTIAVHLKGTFLCTKEVFPIMADQKYGHIINISSISGKRGYANEAAYCAAKFGVIGLTQVIEEEGKEVGIRASVVCPGPTSTYLRNVSRPPTPEEKLCQPEDVAAGVCYVLDQGVTSHISELTIMPSKISNSLGNYT